MAQWAKCADNEVRAFALVYGDEHAAERYAVRRRLEQWNEDNHHEWPREEVWPLWEEMSWRWWEEIKHCYRILLREMGTDSITRPQPAGGTAATTPRGSPQAGQQSPSRNTTGSRCERQAVSGG